jgi:cobalt/nickel transport system permease protein
MHPIDVCAHTNRWSQQHPLQKLLLAGGTLLLSLLLPPLAAGPIILVSMALLALVGAQVPARTYLKFLSAVMAFALIGAVPLAVSVGWGSRGMDLGFSPQGADTAIHVLLRAWAAVSCLLFLAMTTPLATLVSQLRRLKVPGAVIELMLVIYRMLWMLSDVVHRVRVAQASRLGYCGFRQSCRSTGMLAASLLGRIMNRASRLETGLAARGYQGDLNVLVEDRPVSVVGIALTLASQISLVVVSLFLASIFPCLK